MIFSFIAEEMVGKLPITISSLVVYDVLLIEKGYSYKAAVYEHSVIFLADRTRVVNRTDALEIMKKNLFVYSEQCKQASEEVTEHWKYRTNDLIHFRIKSVKIST